MQSTTLSALARPENEGKLYHDETRKGFFTLGWSTKTGRAKAASAIGRINDERDLEKRRMMRDRALGEGYRQRSFPLSLLPEVLSNLDQHVQLNVGDSRESTSVWISQGEFSQPNRQKINLACIAVCWVDLDLRHENSPPQLRRLSRDRAVSAVLERCCIQGIPCPSIVLWTGRGLVLKWLIDVLPKAAYPRWSAVQRMLVEAFSDLGADAAARDASRILRIPGTWNPKSGEVCEPIHIEEFWGEITRYTFDDLANSVLPYTREQIQVLRKQHALARQQRAARLEHHLRVIETEGGGNGNLVAFNPARLAWLQVDDYRRLATMRAVETRPEGWTNTIVWLAASALAVAVWADANHFSREFFALASELAPHWPAARIVQSVSSIKGRMQLMARGEWVEHKGKKRPPIYTPKHSYIIEALRISENEARQLAVILPEDLVTERRLERDRKRADARRRIAGTQSRQTWLESHEGRRSHAHKLRAQGSTWVEVAKACGYPTSDAARMACK